MIGRLKKATARAMQCPTKSSSPRRLCSTISWVSYSTQPHITARPRYSSTWVEERWDQSNNWYVPSPLPIHHPTPLPKKSIYSGHSISRFWRDLENFAGKVNWKDTAKIGQFQGLGSLFFIRKPAKYEAAINVWSLSLFLSLSLSHIFFTLCSFIFQSFPFTLSFLYCLSDLWRP